MQMRRDGLMERSSGPRLKIAGTFELARQSSVESRRDSGGVTTPARRRIFNNGPGELGRALGANRIRILYVLGERALARRRRHRGRGCASIGPHQTGRTHAINIWPTRRFSWQPGGTMRRPAERGCGTEVGALCALDDADDGHRDGADSTALAQFKCLLCAFALMRRHLGARVIGRAGASSRPRRRHPAVSPTLGLFKRQIRRRLVRFRRRSRARGNPLGVGARCLPNDVGARGSSGGEGVFIPGRPCLLCTARPAQEPGPLRGASRRGPLSKTIDLDAHRRAPPPLSAASLPPCRVWRASAGSLRGEILLPDC